MIHGFRFTALGSTGRIRIANVAEATANRAVADAVRWLRDVERRLSRFRDDSLIARLNRGEVIATDADLSAVLAAAERAHHLTGGRYDATAFPLWRLWHDPARATWPTEHEIADARALVAWSQVVCADGSVRLARPGMALDLGGVGKEWCVDRLVERLMAQGCGDVLVDLGGDCAARGAQPGRDGWWVLLPGIAAAIALRDEAIATSGIGTRRRLLAGRAVSHLIDVATGQPAPGLVRSATVIADACLSAGIHASDCCLLDTVTPATIAERSGGNPTWVRARDGTLFADPRLAARLHPVASDGTTAHLAPRTSHLARSA
jgi:thiamine biosynthesis lipoprotein